MLWSAGEWHGIDFQNHGNIMVADLRALSMGGVKSVCYDYDAEAIGKLFLELLPTLTKGMR